jgi:hypothetical protein
LSSNDQRGALGTQALRFAERAEGHATPRRCIEALTWRLCA